MPTAAQREIRRGLRQTLKQIVQFDKDVIFMDPVDDSIEGYYELVQQPMCFRTIESRLEAGHYDESGTLGLLTDVELIASNATLFNGDDSEYHVKGQQLVASARALLASTAASPDHAQRIGKVLSTLMAMDKDRDFWYPVDAAAVPDYYREIASPIDFSMIQSRLSRYSTPAAFLADLQLMANNATAFNGADSKLHSKAQAILAKARALLAENPSKSTAAAAAATSHSRDGKPPKPERPTTPPNKPNLTCAICLLDRAEVECSKCGVAVHAACQPGELIKPDKTGQRNTCLYCRTRASQKTKGVDLVPPSEQTCQACTRPGSLLFVPDSQMHRWLHYGCAVATPGLSLSATKLTVGGLPKSIRLEEDSEDEDAEPCNVCGSSKGVTGKCGRCDSHATAHARCLLETGGAFKGGALLCSQHAQAAVVNVDEVSSEERCGVCFEDDPGSPLLRCDGCMCCVHAECYGLLEQETPLDRCVCGEGQRAIDSMRRMRRRSTWYCRRCASRPLRGIPGLCAACPRPGGALSPVDGSEDWAHVCCVLFLPELAFGNPERMQPVRIRESRARPLTAAKVLGMKNLLETRRNMTCSLCKLRGLPCAQCAEGSCCVAFHASCALEAGLESDRSSGFTLKCARHSARPPRPLEPPQSRLRGNGPLNWYAPRSGKGRGIHARDPGPFFALCKGSPCLSRRPVSGVCAFARARPELSVGAAAEAWQQLDSDGKRRFALAALDSAAPAPGPLRLLRACVTRALDVSGPTSAPRVAPPRPDALLPRDVLSAEEAWRRLDARWGGAEDGMDALQKERQSVPCAAALGPPQRPDDALVPRDAAPALLARAAALTRPGEIVLRPSSGAQRRALERMLGGGGDVEVRRDRAAGDWPAPPVVSFRARLEWAGLAGEVAASGGSAGLADSEARIIEADARRLVSFSVGLAESGILLSSSAPPPPASPNWRLVITAVEADAERVRGPGTVLHELEQSRALLAAEQAANDVLLAKLRARVQERTRALELAAAAVADEDEYRRRKDWLNEQTAHKRVRQSYDASVFCFVCKDEECTFDNAIVICEKCEGAVHQKCYGIDKVPEGDWFCDVCAGVSPSTKPALQRSLQSLPRSPSKPSGATPLLYCTCRQPYVEESDPVFMLECEGRCRDWYHPECIGLSFCEDEECAGFDSGNCIVTAQGQHTIDIAQFRFACPSCSKKRHGVLNKYKKFKRQRTNDDEI